MLHIKSVEYISEFKLWVDFNDGTAGLVDFKDQLAGPVFEPLRDEKFFSRVRIDPELETVVWPNGADLAPEFVKALHDMQSEKPALS